MTATNINNEVKKNNPQRKSFLITFTNKEATTDDKYISICSAEDLFNDPKRIPGVYLNNPKNPELFKDTFLVEVQDVMEVQK